MAYIKNLQTFHFFLIIKDFTHYCAKGGFHRSSPDTADKKAIKTMTAAASKAARQIVLCLGARTMNTQNNIFLKILNFGLGQTNWAKNIGGILEYFQPNYSTHLGTVSPLSMVLSV